MWKRVQIVTVTMRVRELENMIEETAMLAIIGRSGNFIGFILGECAAGVFSRSIATLCAGAAWTIINPAAMIVSPVIFSRIMRVQNSGVDSVFACNVYLCAGMRGVVCGSSGAGKTSFWKMPTY
jgi:hypothetical protein